MVAYLDSSVVLRQILLGEIAIQHAFACARVVSSELLQIECRRVLHRYRLNGDLGDDGFVAGVDRLDSVLAGLSIVELTLTVKLRAMAAFPVAVKTLDALHLATAVVVKEAYLDSGSEEQIVVFSHDATMNRCARALGLAAALA